MVVIFISDDLVLNGLLQIGPLSRPTDKKVFTTCRPARYKVRHWFTESDKKERKPELNAETKILFLNFCLYLISKTFICTIHRLCQDFICIIELCSTSKSHTFQSWCHLLILLTITEPLLDAPHYKRNNVYKVAIKLLIITYSKYTQAFRATLVFL